jgi:hypothetical protein
MPATTKDLPRQEIIELIAVLEERLVEMQLTLSQIVGALTGEPPRPVVRWKRD